MSAHVAGTSSFLLRTSDLAPRTLPKRPGALVRISEDPDDLQRGVHRQTVDCEQMRERINWPPFAKMYTENDTTAYKKKRVRQADGTIVLRVIRPVFAGLLADLQNGVIDGLIVYDQDRLLRQPRDLEDLIDIIEQVKRPVQGVTGQIELMTSSGRAMARVLAAMALKSSEDTARRVSRAALEDARNGSLTRGGPRRFGWAEDGMKLVPAERDVLLAIVKRVMSGDAISAIARDLQASGVPTVTGKKWTRTTINAVLRSPRLAGIRGYQGAFHETPTKMNEWWKRTVRVDGEYVLGKWEPLMSVEDWEALQSALDGGSARGASETNIKLARRRYLLSGLAECGLCGTRMVGRSMHGRSAYGCRPKDMGGCNGVTRNQVKLDKLIVELAVRKLKQQRITGTGVKKAPATTVSDEIAALEKRKEASRLAWMNGQSNDEDYFADQGALATRLAELRAGDISRANVVPMRSRTAAELTDPDIPLHRKRAILADMLEAVVVNPSSRGPHFTAADIVPRWREPEQA